MSISIPVIDLSPFRKGTSDHKKGGGSCSVSLGENWFSCY